jgi:raffinose/stachyose/melibiose transport system permease protein
MEKRKKQMNLFYIPAIILMAVFVAYPFTEAVRISFVRWNGYSQKQVYIGIDNYLRMFHDPNFYRAFVNTLIYGFGSAFLQNFFALLFAVFLNSKFRGHSLVRTVIYLPVMISGLIMGYVISYFVQYRGGVFNEILTFFGQQPIDYMADGTRGVLIILLTNSWQYVGISMIIYLAGLQNIPAVYYEAASIDGATGTERFTKITLPLIVPAMATAVVQNIIGSMKLYDVIISLSQGGPGFSTHSLSTYISNQYFKAQNAGYSAAIGIFTFLFILIISIWITRYFTQKEVDMS